MPNAVCTIRQSVGYEKGGVPCSPLALCPLVMISAATMVPSAMNARPPASRPPFALTRKRVTLAATKFSINSMPIRAPPGKGNLPVILRSCGKNACGKKSSTWVQAIHDVKYCCLTSNMFFSSCASVPTSTITIEHANNATVSLSDPRAFKTSALSPTNSS